MQVLVFDSYVQAKEALDTLNARTRSSAERKRELAVYRVVDEKEKDRDKREKRAKFAIAYSPEQARGRAGPSFGISAMRWPPPEQERQALALEQIDLTALTEEELHNLIAEARKEEKERKRRPPREDG